MYVNGKNTLVKDNATTPDIIEALLNAVPVAVNQCKGYVYKMINKSGNPLVDAERCCRYIRANVKYKADGFNEQNIQLPGRMFKGTKQADCKSFSLAFVGMMKALGYDAGFRFASYKKNKIPTHVYNFVLCNGKKYIFDACIENLKESKSHTYLQDMKVQYLSGPAQNAAAAMAMQLDMLKNSVEKMRTLGKTELEIKSFVRDRMLEIQNKTKEALETPNGFDRLKRGVAKVALTIPRNSFRALVSFNFRGLATQLDRAIQKNRGKVKDFWEHFGGKFDGGDSLMQSINVGKNKNPLFGAKDENRPGSGVGFYYADTEEAYIGFDPATDTVALIATATPIILAVKDLLKSLGVKEGDIRGLIFPNEAKEGDKLPDGFPEYDPKAAGAFEISPVMIGGIVGGLALLYFLVIKKKR